MSMLQQAESVAMAPRGLGRGGGIEKLQLKIGGMSCSFCIASMTKALERTEGVQRASVNLTHEEALIEYDPAKVSPRQLKKLIIDLGYTVRDPRKVLTFEEEQAELIGQRNNLLLAGAFALVAVTMMILMWAGVVPNPQVVPHPLPLQPLLMPFLALATIFGPGWHNFRMQAFGGAWPGAGPEWAGSGPKTCQDGSILAHWAAALMVIREQAAMVYASSAKRTVSTRAGPFLGTVFFFVRGLMMLMAEASSCVFKCAA